MLISEPGSFSASSTLSWSVAATGRSLRWRACFSAASMPGNHAASEMVSLSVRGRRISLIREPSGQMASPEA